MSVTRATALAATGGTESGTLPAELRVVTDTRSLRPGDTFLALQGPNFDGHVFVAEALARGAVAAVVADAAVLPEGFAGLVVGNTHAAYLALAGVARAASRARFVAITGSTGKTTTKDLLAQLLAATGARVSATPANENNEIGVAKLLLALEPDAEFAVVELGARHYGEIAPLAELVRPEVAVLTNIGEAHLEIMGSLERLAETKWGIFVTGAVPVLDAVDAVSRQRGGSDPQALWFDAVDEMSIGDEIRRYAGLAGGRVVERERSSFEVVRKRDGKATSEEPRSDVRIPGDHNRRNLAAAFAAAVALGLEPAALAAAVPSLTLPAGRYERLRAGDFDLVYDAYNASASGTVATLGSFAREPAARRLAVLGSMAELGDDAPALHERTGVAAAGARLDTLLALGPHAADLARGARYGGMAAERIVLPSDNAAAVAWLRTHARAGDLVLLKASRRYHFEEIADALRRPAAAAPAAAAAPPREGTHV